MNVAVTVPLLPSLKETSVSERLGTASSLMIVPVPLEVAIVALAAFDKTTVKVSLGSKFGSPKTCTATVLDVSPGANVRTPPLET